MGSMTNVMNMDQDSLDQMPVSNNLKGHNPCIFISSNHYPVTLESLEMISAQLKRFNYDSVQAYPKTGLYITFPDTSEGQADAGQCHSFYNMSSLSGHILPLEYYPSGISLSARTNDGEILTTRLPSNRESISLLTAQSTCSNGASFGTTTLPVVTEWNSNGAGGDFAVSERYNNAPRLMF